MDHAKSGRVLGIRRVLLENAVRISIAKSRLTVNPPVILDTRIKTPEGMVMLWSV
jgi:hypothetical protein